MNQVNLNTELTHYPFPSIGQYANIIANVNRKCTYVGKNELDEPLYDPNAIKPVLKFIGTTKLHGTNAGVIIDFANNTIYFESRDTIITPEKDNAGFARFMSQIQEEFVNTVIDTFSLTGTDWDPSSELWKDNVFAIYGEWCGGSIQKGVALNQLEKMFVLFGGTIRTRETFDNNGVPLMSRELDWVPIEDFLKLKLKDKKVYNIYDYKTWEIIVDFNKHYESTNSIINSTIEVEDECPFSAEMGVKGIGEGIVFKCVTPPYTSSDFWFKSKGEKHSKSKVKTIKAVDNDKINRLIEIAEKVTPSWRLEQMFNSTFDTLNGGIITREKLGEYLKAVSSDICKEEKLLFEEEGIEMKDIASFVGKISREYFFQLEKEMLTNPN